MSFKCKLCAAYIEKSHIRQHYRLLHLSEHYFPCPFECSSNFRKLNCLSMHIFRFHNSQKNRITLPKFLTLKCPACSIKNGSETKFWSIRSLTLHLKNVHLRKNKELVDCYYKNCQFKTKNVGTFISHFSRCHNYSHDDISLIDDKYFDVNDCVAVENSSFSLDNDEQLLTSQFDEIDVEPESSGPAILDDESAAGKFEKSLALFFLKMQVVWNISESVIQEISEMFTDIHKQSVEDLFRSLSGSTVNYMNEIQLLNNDFLSKLTGANGNLSSHYRRQIYFKKNLPLIEPG